MKIRSGTHRRFKLFEELLDVVAEVGKEPVPKGFHLDLLYRPLPSRNFIALARASIARCSDRAEDDPVNADVPAGLDQLQQGAAAPDLDVVGVRAETQNPQR